MKQPDDVARLLQDVAQTVNGLTALLNNVPPAGQAFLDANIRGWSDVLAALSTAHLHRLTEQDQE